MVGQWKHEQIHPAHWLQEALMLLGRGFVWTPRYRSRSTIRPASEVLPSVAKTLAKLPEDLAQTAF